MLFILGTLLVTQFLIFKILLKRFSEFLIIIVCPLTLFFWMSNIHGIHLVRMTLKLLWMLIVIERLLLNVHLMMRESLKLFTMVKILIHWKSFNTRRIRILIKSMRVLISIKTVLGIHNIFLTLLITMILYKWLIQILRKSFPGIVCIVIAVILIRIVRVMLLTVVRLILIQLCS